MKSKGYFLGRNPDPQKNPRRTWILLLIVAVVLIPAIFVLINYTVESGQVTAPEQNQLQISLYHGGELYVEETGNPDVAKEGLVAIFASLRKNLKEAKALPDDVNTENMIRAVYVDNGVSSEYFCYFSFNQNYSFCVDSDSKVYAISETDVEAFLDSSYSQPLFQAAIPPAMLTTANDTVIPNKVSWQYRNDSGDFLDAANISTDSETNLYTMAGRIGIRFDTTPDECTVTVFKSGLILHEDIPHTALSNITVDPGTTLRFKVRAVWTEREDRNFCGELLYDFEALIKDRSEFILERQELYAGEFTLISCTNIITPSRIQFSCEPSIGYEPVFFEDDDLVRAIIPFSASLTPGTYTVKLTYGVTEQLLPITVKERPDADTHLFSSSSAISTMLSSEAGYEFDSLLHTLSQKHPTTRYFRDRFLDYSEEFGTPLLSFGDTVFFKNSEQAYTSTGIEYAPSNQSGGAPVPVANAGIVVFAGHTEHLGNVVVVEHGLGLRTWYAHLSEIVVHEGYALTKGQTVGNTGGDGFSGGENFFLICTVFDVPVDYAHRAGQHHELPEVPKDPSKDQAGFLD